MDLSQLGLPQFLPETERTHPLRTPDPVQGRYLPYSASRTQASQAIITRNKPVDLAQI